MKPKQKTGLSFLLALIIAVTATVSGFAINTFITLPGYSYPLFAIIKTVVLLLAAIVFLVSLMYLYKMSVGGWKKVFAFVTGIILIVLILELVFSFVITSTNVYSDMTNQLWLKTQFKPINTLGYRDQEIVNHDTKKNILVIGDSFVAGHGIKANKRFSNIMKASLRENYDVYNLGVCGSHTDREFDSLLNYPVNPDVIILGYYHNDIESAMIKFNRLPDIKNPRESLSATGRLLVNNSLFFNYVYARFIGRPKVFQQVIESPKIDMLAYLDEELWNYQKKSLDKFYDYAAENDAELIILFLPAMNNGITLSHALAGKKIQAYSQTRNISYVDPYSLIISLPQKERMAGNMDSHPSPEVNRIIADTLIKTIQNIDHHRMTEKQHSKN